MRAKVLGLLLAIWAFAADVSAQEHEPITLAVDLTDSARGIWRIEQTFPVQPDGLLVLRYPEWLPGVHAPRGPIDKIAGIRVEGGGRNLVWRRDASDIYALTIDVPPDVTSVTLRFDFLSPLAPDQGRIVAAPQLANLRWDSVVFYPAGQPVDTIRVSPSIVTPPGWHVAGALQPLAQDGPRIRYPDVSLRRLVDAPLLAGAVTRRVAIGRIGAAPVDLAMFADSEAEIAPDQEQIAAHTRAVEQTGLLLGQPPFDRYTMLLGISPHLGRTALEHLDSAEIVTGPGYFTDWETSFTRRDLVPHELIHAWNGKRRTGAGMARADYAEAPTNAELWVYEGLTEYLGYVVAARAGLLDGEQYRAMLALAIAEQTARRGRDWRPLADTLNDPPLKQRRPQPWPSWQRGEDYYPDGQLLWLAVDAELRAGGTTLDAFARRFLAPDRPATYDRAEVVATLAALHPMDWRAFLDQRLDRPGGFEPTAALLALGWQLEWRDTPDTYLALLERRGDMVDQRFSIGLAISTDPDNAGRVTETVWGSPAFDAGIVPGTRIIAIGGQPFSRDALISAIGSPAGEISFEVERAAERRTVTIGYAGGVRYPMLARIPGIPDRLADILRPRIPD